LQQTSSVTDKWEGNIIEKLKGILKTSKKNLGQVFASFDTDGSGKLSLVEFRNAIRKLGLGLSSKDIDTLMQQADTNGD
jgi:Ca2+-binding EF-hand superfamily protein